MPPSGQWKHFVITNNTLRSCCRFLTSMCSMELVNLGAFYATTQTANINLSLLSWQWRNWVNATIRTVDIRLPLPRIVFAGYVIADSTCSGTVFFTRMYAHGSDMPPLSACHHWDRGNMFIITNNLVCRIGEPWQHFRQLSDSSPVCILAVEKHECIWSVDTSVLLYALLVLR